MSTKTPERLSIFEATPATQSLLWNSIESVLALMAIGGASLRHMASAKHPPPLDFHIQDMSPT